MANNTNGTSVIAKIPSGVWIFLTALNIFLSIFATLGNVLILVALRNVSSIHPPTKLLFRCLAITDLCVGLLCQPLYVYDMYIRISLDIGDYIVEPFLVYDFIFGVLLAVSILTSAAISVDRLLALLLGLRYRHVVTLRRVRVVMACVWFIAVSNASLWLVNVIQFKYKVLFACSLWTFIALIMVSIIISLFSYIKIFFTFRHQQAQVRDHVQPEQSSRVRSVLNIARYKKTVYSVAWIQFAMLACYGPIAVMVFLWDFGNIDYSTEIAIADEFFRVLLFLNSSLNPVLYCWRIKDFRQEVKTSFVSVSAFQLTCSDREKMQQSNKDNWLVTNSAAMLIPAHTTYTDRTHIVHRISFPCTLIFFCLNRVMKYVWRCLRRLKRAKRTLIKSSVDFGCGHIGFSSMILSRNLKVSFWFFLLLFCLSRVRKDVCWRLRLLKTPEKTLIYKESVCTRRENH